MSKASNKAIVIDEDKSKFNQTRKKISSEHVRQATIITGVDIGVFHLSVTALPQEAQEAHSNHKFSIDNKCKITSF